MPAVVITLADMDTAIAAVIDPERQQKAMVIAATARLVKKGASWLRAAGITTAIRANSAANRAAFWGAACVSTLRRIAADGRPIQRPACGGKNPFAAAATIH